MFRRKPTSVTLTPLDVDMFKEIIREQQLQRDQAQHKPVENESDQDDIFMGHALTKDHLKRDLHERLGIKGKKEEYKGYEEEEEDEDIEVSLFKKTRY